MSALDIGLAAVLIPAALYLAADLGVGGPVCRYFADIWQGRR